MARAGAGRLVLRGLGCCRHLGEREGGSGQPGAGGRDAKGSFGACFVGKGDKIGWGAWEEGLGMTPSAVG